MKLDRTLNLVVPVERADGTTAYVFATPISRQVFDQFFLVIGKTFTRIHNEGLGIVGGPRLAAKMLKLVASEMGQTDAVQNGLLAEMRRLTNVIVAGSPPLPLDLALSQQMIDPEDAEEAENAVAFFMLASAMHRREEIKAILNVAMTLWGAQITSSAIMEFSGSLRTSTPAAATGPRAPQSHIPS